MEGREITIAPLIRQGWSRTQRCLTVRLNGEIKLNVASSVSVPFSSLPMRFLSLEMIVACNFHVFPLFLSKWSTCIYIKTGSPCSPKYKMRGYFKNALPLKFSFKWFQDSILSISLNYCCSGMESGFILFSFSLSSVFPPSWRSVRSLTPARARTLISSHHWWRDKRE